MPHNLRGLSHMENLVFESNPIARVSRSVFRECDRIKFVSIIDNTAIEPTLWNLTEAVGSSNLTAFALQNNNISSQGANVFAKELPHSTLRQISLSYNNIGDAGAKSLAEIINR